MSIKLLRACPQLSSFSLMIIPFRPPSPLMISSSFLHKNEIERKAHLDVMQVMWYIFQRTSLIFLHCARALFSVFLSYDICHHFSTPPLTIGIIITENNDNCGLSLIPTRNAKCNFII